jgi:hypothetical protein
VIGAAHSDGISGRCGAPEVDSHARILSISRGGALIASPVPVALDSIQMVKFVVNGDEIRIGPGFDMCTTTPNRDEGALQLVSNSCSPYSCRTPCLSGRREISPDIPLKTFYFQFKSLERLTLVFLAIFVMLLSFKLLNQ